MSTSNRKLRKSVSMLAYDEIATLSQIIKWLLYDFYVNWPKGNVNQLKSQSPTPETAWPSAKPDAVLARVVYLIET